MNNETAGRIRRSFWVIGVVALIWNVLGVVNFFAMTFASNLDAMPAWWHAVIESRPAWATGAMAVAVFGGAIGCILLLLRKSSAYYVFIASLLGTIVATSHAFSVSGPTIGPGARQIFEAIILPLAMAAFLIWYSKRAESKGWMSQELVASN